jgi:hypothetical protein
MLGTTAFSARTEFSVTTPHASFMGSNVSMQSRVSVPYVQAQLAANSFATTTQPTALSNHIVYALGGQTSLTFARQMGNAVL